MRTERSYASCAFVFQKTGRLGEGTSRVADIVYKNYIPVGYIANYHHAGYLICPFSMLVADDHFCIEIGGDFPYPVGTAHVGGRKGKVFHLKLLDVRNEYGRAVEVVNRYIKIALDLRGMEVHSD